MTVETPEKREEDLVGFPSKHTLDSIYRDTLAWLQEHNPDLTEIPRGVPCKATMCPLARGLDPNRRFRVLVGANTYTYLDDISKERKLPRCASRFRAYFDCGKYPDLIERDSR